VAFRNYASSQSPDKKWLVFDGPVDAIWIENMNTVLDDNKKLCLNSGEIIQLSPTMSLIFEVRDLSVASPATVSRCGMIYLEPSRIGWRETLFVSWLNNDFMAENEKQLLTHHVDWLLASSLEFLRVDCTEICETQDANLVLSMLRIFESQYKEAKAEKKIEEMSKRIQGYFLFSLIWSIGATANEESRAKFSTFLKESLMAPPPEITEMAVLPDGEGTVYDFLFDKSNWYVSFIVLSYIAPGFYGQIPWIPNTAFQQRLSLMILWCLRSIRLVILIF
jgi:dynein heavy chain